MGQSPRDDLPLVFDRILHLNLFRDIQCIFNFDAEISHRAFEFGMAQEELDRTDVSGLAINQ